MTTQTTATANAVSAAFDLNVVRTADQTSQMIVAAKGTQKLANQQWHYACIGSSLQVLQHGNRTPLTELLNSLGKKSQRYQKILECLRTLTGGMLTITENGTGTKHQIEFEYKFDADVKLAMLGDPAADDYDETKTEFYRLAQKPWFEYELANEDYGFDAEKFSKSFANTAKKGAMNGMSLDQLLAKVEEGYAAGLKEKKEKEDEEKRAAAAALANVEGGVVVNAMADEVRANLPEGHALNAELDGILASFTAGDITKAGALSRIAGVEETYTAEVAAAERQEMQRANDDAAQAA